MCAEAQSYAFLTLSAISLSVSRSPSGGVLSSMMMSQSTSALLSCAVMNSANLPRISGGICSVRLVNESKMTVVFGKSCALCWMVREREAMSFCLMGRTFWCSSLPVVSMKKYLARSIFFCLRFALVSAYVFVERMQTE